MNSPAVNYRTQFSKHVRVFCNAGSPVKILYGLSTDGKGVTNLVEKGKESLYDRIQSHKDSVDIHKILERFENGDINALSKYQGYYGDITEMPTTYAGMLDLVNKCQDLFDSLPLSAREKFNFSCEQFISAIGTKEFNDVFSESIQSGSNNGSEVLSGNSVDIPGSVVSEKVD